METSSIFCLIACFIKHRSSMLISEGSGLHFASIRDMWKWDFCIHFENKHTWAKCNEHDSIYSFLLLRIATVLVLEVFYWTV